MRACSAARCRGFTLIELLVVVAIIALLIAIILPSLANARFQARKVVCLTNMRSLEQAHWMYLTANGGYLIEAGLGHRGEADDVQAAWINTLKKIYKDKLLLKSPLDDSPHWPVSEGGQGVVVPNKAAGEYPYRQSSYGINDYLSVRHAEGVILDENGPRTWKKIEHILNPADIVHFLFMAREGEFAGSDHPHVYQWDTTSPPTKAATQVEIGIYGGPSADWSSLAPYGFLDGHAESLQFQKVYKSFNNNKFDPALAYRGHR